MIHPPKHALAFLRWFCREDYLEEVEGNLMELFDVEAENSVKQALKKIFRKLEVSSRTEMAVQLSAEKQPR